MIKGLVTWFLNNYLGKYLEDLNTDQLSIALLQGEVELDNVPLRKDALRFVDPTLVVRKGLVGKIKLRIPVSRLRSEPWSIVMDRVYVVVGPSRHDEDYDELDDEALAEEIKLAALDGIESEWRATHDVDHTASSYYTSYSSWMSYGTSFIGTIIENLQVQIRDVHVRYEDDTSFPGRPFACGISIDSLAAQSCDENWAPKFVFRETGNVMAYKIVELQNLAAYLNSASEDEEMYGSIGDDDNDTFIEKMSNVAAMPKEDNKEFEFVLNPVTATATIKRNCSERPLNSRKTPRIVCDLQLSNVELDITDRQYQCVVRGARTLHQLHKNRAYWKWRPRVGVKSNSRLWWQYAITCHMEIIHERNVAACWQTVLRKASENVKYVEAFMKYLENPVVIDPELKEHKEAMDSTRTYDELKALREQAVFLLKKKILSEEDKVPDLPADDVVAEEADPGVGADVSETEIEEEKLDVIDTAVGDLEVNSPSTEQAPAQSTLQRWFPLWGGWYADGQDQGQDGGLDQEQQQEEEEQEFFSLGGRGMPRDRSFEESMLEDEIMGALADEANLIAYKDLVFAQLSFTLKRGTTRLLTCSSPSGTTSPTMSKKAAASRKRLLFEFEFTDTKIECENRPRIRSYKFTMSLGAMYVRDRVTPGTVFPLLVSPQFVVGAPLGPKSSNPVTSLGGIGSAFKSFLSGSLNQPEESVASTEPLFYFLYEKRPLSSSKVDFRLNIKSQPLNVVYNPTMVTAVIDFFKIPEDLNRTAQLSQKIRQAAYSRIEEAKQKTKEELERNINSLFDETYVPSKSKVWDISFDLSAPQILIPEHFANKEALIMVLDFGKLRLENEDSLALKNAAEVKTTKMAASLPKPAAVQNDDTDDEDEEFITPASTPTSPTTMSKQNKSSILKPEITSREQAKKVSTISTALSEGLENINVAKKFYERYTVSLNDMQVIVGRVKDNWRSAHLRGTSSLHILDKFSIELHCERRIVGVAAAANPEELPNVVISGTLPKLNVHVNEDKLHTLSKIGGLIMGDPEVAAENNIPVVIDDELSDKDEETYFQPWRETTENDESKYLLLYFCVAEMSVELQSMGRSIAELQVTGVKAKRLFDTNVAASVRTTEVALGSLVVEDLLDSSSKHRKLATSISEVPTEKLKPAFNAASMSTSCPNLATTKNGRRGQDDLLASLNDDLSISLPDNLDAEFGLTPEHPAEAVPSTPMASASRPPASNCSTLRRRNRRTSSRLSVGNQSLLNVELPPATPPPSKCSSRASSPLLIEDEAKQRDLQRDDHLVYIKIVDVNKKHPDFAAKHNNTNRFVEIDFNTLDIMFNLKSWVLIFDFFGIGSPSATEAETATKSSKNNTLKRSKSQNIQPQQEVPKGAHLNTEVDIKVKALSVMLNHEAYEVAVASVKNFVSRMSLRDGNFAIGGSLGNFFVKDLTPQGSLYRDRFLLMQGHDTVLKFNFFKYGRTDEKLEREYDATLKLRMASVIYVHTQRFYSELLAFFNHFHQHQSVMNRIRVAAMGSEVAEMASRGSRIKLDVEAGSPLLLLPMSSRSTQLLVINLGFLEIANTFMFAGDEGTISSQTLRSALASQLVESRRRRRSGSRSSRSSARSRSRQSRFSSGLKSPASNASSIHHSRTREKKSAEPRTVRGMSSDTFEDDDDEDEAFDTIKELPNKPHKCLLDVLNVSLRSINLRTADRLSAFTEAVTDEDIYVESFIVRPQPKKVLKEKCELKLQIERNLDKAFSHQVPDLSINGVLSRVHASVDTLQYMLIRGLLGYNLGENLDDLAEFQASIPTNEYPDPELQTLLSGIVWTCMYMNIELQDVILDLRNSSVCEKKSKSNHRSKNANSRKQKEQPALARVNLFKSFLTYESFSDSSRDIDLVSQEILLSDLRFSDCPMNKRSNVFAQILQPLRINDERQSLLQAEVHFRLTPETNRITILVNNMRLMGIFDWWLAVLDFISKNAEDTPAATLIHPDHVVQKQQQQSDVRNNHRLFYVQEEPIYPSAGIVSRRAAVVEAKGPVFELKLNITDSDFIIVSDPSVADSSAVILRSTTVIAYRPDMIDRPFSCNLNNAEVFSCVLGNEEESALSIIDPVTINFEIASRNVGGLPPKGLTDLLADEVGESGGIPILGTYERTAEIQLQQLNVRLSYHDWLMFQTILESFPRQAQEAFSGRSNAAHGVPGSADDQQDQDQDPANVEQQLTKLADLGFSRPDCRKALEACQGQIDDAALWLTQNATPTSAKPEDNRKVEAEAETKQQYYLQGTNVSFTNFEFKTSSVNICIIDDCKDADVPLLELMMQRLHLRHDFEGIGNASSTLSGSYYNRALSSWEPFMEPWRCALMWKTTPIGYRGLNSRLTLNVETENTVNFNLTSTLIELYHMVKANWTEDYYNESASTHIMASSSNMERHYYSNSNVVAFRRRVPFVPFALKNETGCVLWFCTQIQTAGSQFAPNMSSKPPTLSAFGFSSSASLEGGGPPDIHGEPQWKQVEPGDEVAFSFEGRGKLRHLNTRDIKIHQIIVRVNGWQEVTPVSVDRVGTYFRKAPAIPMLTTAMGSASATTFVEMPPARVVFDVSLEGSARKLVTVRSALLLENKLATPVQMKLENDAINVGDVREVIIQPGQTRPVPLNYVWARMFAKLATVTGSAGTGNGGLGGFSQWKYSEKPINWYHIMTASDNSLDVHTSGHSWKKDAPVQRFCVAVRRKNYPTEASYRGGHGSGLGGLEALRPRQPASGSSTWIQPAHTITFVPPIVIVNLLPCHLRYQLRDADDQDMNSKINNGTNVQPGRESFLPADISKSLVIKLALDLYPFGADLTLPAGSSNFEAKLNFADSQSRPLQLMAKVTSIYGGAIRVSVYAKHWLVNKTGLPLVFRQEGASIDAAGQEEENEVARLAAPLMFAFNDALSETGSTSGLTMRIGNSLHDDYAPNWTRSFHLQPGSRVRKLNLTPIKDTRRVNRVYLIGIEVRIGKGRYRDTLIVTLSPRFQIHNRSPFKIQIAQECFASTFYDPEAEATHLQAFPESSLAYHWPRLDRDQLLCVRIMDVPPPSMPTQSSASLASMTSSSSLWTKDLTTTMWSGGMIIDKVDSFHVAVRDKSGRATFVRVEVSLIGATYCIVLADAANFPPPFRIDNFSEVAVTCHQTGITDETLKTVVKARQSVPYAWDEPTLPPHLTTAAPGGSSAHYNMNVTGEGSQLTYENFIYVVMTETFNKAEDQELVLDVDGTKVFLARKETGKRSQLWRMTSQGMLQHEGSSPPQDPGSSKANNRADLEALMRNSLVLDIAGPAVQPHSYVHLMLRRPDERRQLTQRWRFTDDGRLMCAHRGLYVQAKDGFNGVQKGRRADLSHTWQMWNDVVLGPSQPVCIQRTSEGVPIEQAIGRQRLRPGSGVLTVRVTTDGPTRVLQVMDANRSSRVYARLEERDWNLINEDKRPQLVAAASVDESINKNSASTSTASGSTATFVSASGRKISSSSSGPGGDPAAAPGFNDGGKSKNELQVIFLAKSGIGVSLVSREPCEELLYAFMSNVVIDYQRSASNTVLDGSVQNVQVDNQLQDAASPIVLFLSPATRSDEFRHMPAVSFTANRANVNHDNAEIYKHILVQVKNITLNLEEELLCKVLKFAGITRSDEEMERIDESAYDAQHALIISTTTAKRFYFGTLKMALNQIKLSVTKSHKLSPDLVAVKRKLGLSLIAFEDALIELDPFIRVHPFETINFLTNAVVKHYTDELLSQAILILGSTDFLGNPIGFFNDLTEGVSGLVSEGDVGGLIKNVAHGAANSAAKVTGSLSYGISKATVYDKYNERRLMLKKRRGVDRSKEHLVDGLKGLGFGMYQGLTSIVTETYEGVSNDGITGFFTGLTWGLIGTVSKPALGVLDLATGAATAVKESSRSKHRELPPRMRPPRLVLGPGGSMPVYSKAEAVGQELLYTINSRDYNEIYVAHEILRKGDIDDLQILITCDRVLVFSGKSNLPNPAEDGAASTASSEEAGESPASNSKKLSKNIRVIVNISHGDLVCARTVTEQEIYRGKGMRPRQVSDYDSETSMEAVGGSTAHGVDGNKKFFLELVGKFDDEDGGGMEQRKRPQVRCDSEKIARLVTQQINYARSMFDEMTQAVIESIEQDEL